LTEEPLLAPAIGDRFDRDGVTTGCVIEHNGETLLYYVGWRLEPDVPFRTQIGCARFDSGSGKFERISEMPIVERDEIDPHSFSYPWIVTQPDGTLRMYYGTATYWKDSTETQEHVLRVATSADGLKWEKRREPILIPDGEEIAVVRPAVYPAGDGFEMWLSARAANGPYSLSYARSSDGMSWRRDPKKVEIPSRSGWFDDSMQCYAVRLRLSGQDFLLYNGNRYGQTGIGAARLA